jgi:membrane protease subunit (stomatin/prohibitin family)
VTIEVIEALDPSGMEMVRRVPANGSGEFKLGAQVIVRESQTAVFFRDGKSYDTFEPGRHTLTTLNLPLIGERVTDRVFGESPFKAEVYFVNQKVFLNLRWGTRDPITYRDTELDLVRLRARGLISLRVDDAVLFVNNVVGTQGVYRTEQIHGYIKTLVLSALAQVIGGELKSIVDLPVRYEALSTATKAKVQALLETVGVELLDFVIEAITPPDEVQRHIDERGGIAAIGDLDRYLRYKTATALEEAARQPGGVAGAVTGAGAGLSLGMMLPQLLAQGAQNSAGAQQQAPPTLRCVGCQRDVELGSKFCPGCGSAIVANACAKCGADLAPGSKFCAGCGEAVGK